MPIFPIPLVALAATLLAPSVSGQYSPHFPEPPNPEPIEVVELPLPPVVSSNATGACTAKINPRGTGCIGVDTGGEQDFQSGDFTPDGKHIVANVVFIGAPAAPDPASIYDGEQLILITTDGTKFPNGDPWKCITCGVPSKNAPWLDPQRDYPHVFRSGDKALWGHNIVSCGSKSLASDGCTPHSTHIYPIHWTVTTDGTGKGGSPREMRLHPDDEHMGWSSFTNTGGQYTYFGRLEFNADPQVGEPLVPRYDLVDVNILVDKNGKPPMYVEGEKLIINHDGDSGNYFGQQVNSDGDRSDGSANDPNWNGRADPAVSPDSSMIAYWQALVVSPSCGGVNPLPCPVSTAQGGRNYRVMLARRTSLKPSKPAPVFKAPDFIPWAKPFPAGSTTPKQYEIPAGNYTLDGQLSGVAEVAFIEDPDTGAIQTISASYSNYSDQDGYIINGYEKVSKWKLLPNVWKDRVEWFSNITQTGVVDGTKITSKDGFELEIDVSVNIMETNGTLTTVLDGIKYVQPAAAT
ncbi:saponin hydrolase precursor [Fusarium napiforme]|uniref:Saponin hydrolase n=1 Tax=Fusarium napiforme TaxID=42672 RepID=A0A8H5N7C8_9HYPO|nr:saponin hydrolase precursor [Fusarium napiforme]